jgi:hypothetical protein
MSSPENVTKDRFQGKTDKEPRKGSEACCPMRIFYTHLVTYHEDGILSIFFLDLII